MESSTKSLPENFAMYTDTDPYYEETPLVSTIPPPDKRRLPESAQRSTERSRGRGRGRGRGHGRGGYNHNGSNTYNQYSDDKRNFRRNREYNQNRHQGSGRGDYSRSRDQRGYYN
eukprot:CFRG1354T1